MTIPDYQSIMLPLLRLAADDQEHTVSEATDILAEQFKLTYEERKQLLPSGKQATFDNRVGWSKTYLTKAGFLENTGRARFRITPRGVEVLAQDPQRIDWSFLKQFPEFVEFQTASKKLEPAAISGGESPEEIMDASYQSLRLTLAQDLPDTVKKCSPHFFERLVVDLLVAMGYGGTHKDAAQAVGRSGDAGIDGIIKEDKLGLDIVYVQAKRWENSVSRPTVQAFAGSLDGQMARRGVLITTSQFTGEARDYVKRIDKKIILIDGEQLAELMIEHNVGVSLVSAYEGKKIDADYFGDGA